MARVLLLIAVLFSAAAVLTSALPMARLRHVRQQQRDATALAAESDADDLLHIDVDADTDADVDAAVKVNTRVSVHWEGGAVSCEVNAAVAGTFAQGLVDALKACVALQNALPWTRLGLTGGHMTVYQNQQYDGVPAAWDGAIPLHKGGAGPVRCAVVLPMMRVEYNDATGNARHVDCFTNPAWQSFDQSIVDHLKVCPALVAALPNAADLLYTHVANFYESDGNNGRQTVAWRAPITRRLSKTLFYAIALRTAPLGVVTTAAGAETAVALLTINRHPVVGVDVAAQLARIGALHLAAPLNAATVYASKCTNAGAPRAANPQVWNQAICVDGGTALKLEILPLEGTYAAAQRLPIDGTNLYLFAPTGTLGNDAGAVLRGPLRPLNTDPVLLLRDLKGGRNAQARQDLADALRGLHGRVAVHWGWLAAAITVRVTPVLPNTAAFDYVVGWLGAADNSLQENDQVMQPRGYVRGHLNRHTEYVLLRGLKAFVQALEAADTRFKVTAIDSVVVTSKPPCNAQDHWCDRALSNFETDCNNGHLRTKDWSTIAARDGQTPLSQIDNRNVRAPGEAIRMVLARERIADL